MINPFLRRIKKGPVFEGSSQQSSKESMRIFPLGGTGNVTKNMFVYEYRYDGKLRDILIVDCGIGFPDAEMFGADLVLPDVRYLEDKKSLIRGLVFTHGPDDHIGGIAHLYPKLGRVPMWGTTLTAAFTNLKLSQAHIKSKVTPCSFDQTLRIGPFTVSFVHVTH